MSCILLKRILNCELVILCDVENKLLGENGTAKIFGPQNGASANDIQKLELALSKFAGISFKATGIIPGAYITQYKSDSVRLINGKIVAINPEVVYAKTVEGSVTEKISSW